MTTQTPSASKILYEQDYNLWLETTLQQLRQQAFSSVDWENLIEELEGMARSDKRALRSLLTRLFEHLLKLSYWESEREYNTNKWKAEIRNFRNQLKDLLKDSPSLKPYLAEVFNNCYQDARKIMADLTTLPLETFPTQSIANIEQILDENWLPIND